jgi:putative SOS response-associated peptidase YedK
MRLQLERTVRECQEPGGLHVNHAILILKRPLRLAKNLLGKKPKFEFAVRDRTPFGMAGLWSPWKNPKTNQWEDTFAIVTVEANETMMPVHDRQPAILAPRDYQEYLENAERPPIHLVRVFPDDEMRAEEIDQEPISNEQASLFDSQ